MVTDGFIDRQRQVSQDFAEEKHRSGVLRQQKCMFAAPAQSRLTSEFHFKHWRRIGSNAVPKLTNLHFDTRCELLQALAQNLVIVAAACVNRNDGGIGFV